MNDARLEQPAAGTLLICTVGGSPAPIATALRLLRPDAAHFLVSDGTGGEKSSRLQVENNEIDYDERQGIRGPGLRFVCGCPAVVQVIEIPADDPDRAYTLCRSHIADARRQHPEHRLIADYTGGTKSMSAALLMAALAQEGAEVQLMVGERRDLHRVKAGSEQPRRMASDFIMAERDFAAAEQAVAGYDYAAAYTMLDGLNRRLRAARIKLPERFCERLETARGWTRVMAEWDAFRHADAADIARRAQNRGAWLGTSLATSGHLQPLLALGEREQGVPDWKLCADLRLNALRRGDRGRFDDAVARLYRLVEASAQAWLWTRYRLRSGHIPFAEIPEAMRDELRSEADGEGNVKLGLNNVVRFLRYRDPGDAFALRYVGEAVGADVLRGPPWLMQRNLSILAHGFDSVSPRVWNTAREWTETLVRPCFQHEEFPQLPRKIPPLEAAVV